MARGWQFLIGVGCIAGAVWTAKQALEYRRDGIVVVGVVAKVDAKLAVDDGALSYSERPVVTYRRHQSARNHTLEFNWISPLISSHEPGDKVKVRYLPDDLDAAREDSLVLDWALPVVLLVLGCAGLAGQLRPGGGEWVLWRSGND